MAIATSSARATALATAGEGNRPLVAWNNLAATASISGNTPITGSAFANAVSGSTYDKYLPQMPSTFCTLTFDFGSAVDISFAAIAAHNLATLGGAASVTRSTDNVTYTDAGAGTITPTDNSPMAWRMATTGLSARYWRFNFTGLAINAPLAIGVAFLGNDLVLPRPFYQGFSPVITPTEVELQSNVSVGNELLGSSVILRGSTLSAGLQNVSPSFIRGASWLSFQNHFNDGKGFFFAWRPTKYTGDVHYCWRNGPVIRPTNSGPKDLMSFDMQAQVHEAPL